MKEREGAIKEKECQQPTIHLKLCLCVLWGRHMEWSSITDPELYAIQTQNISRSNNSHFGGKNLLCYKDMKNITSFLAQVSGHIIIMVNC